MGEVIRHTFKHNVFALGWRQKTDSRQLKLAVGSFKEKLENQITILEFDEATETLQEVKPVDKYLEINSHPYPPTKIIWMPDLGNQYSADLLATASDYLRIWESRDDGTVRQKCVFNNSKSNEFSLPLTSFDWCEHDPRLLVSASIDTTCTVWDVEVGVGNQSSQRSAAAAMTVEKKTPQIQVKAHDYEVYDVVFKPNQNTLFGSVGYDGSFRVLDRRDLKNSSIVYEGKTPLLRLSWNKFDENFVAIFGKDDTEIKIIDLRAPQDPVVVLGGRGGHKGGVKGMAWAPSSSFHLVSAGFNEDNSESQALIWDVSKSTSTGELEPELAYGAESAINQVQWCSAAPEWVAISCNRCVEVLRV